MCRAIDRGCEQHAHQAPWRRSHRPEGCCCFPGYARRRFPTEQEMIKELEEYLESLQAEAKGVEERITELRQEA